MNIVTAGTLFAVIILIYWIIWELFSMLFRFTGFPDDKARFQVLSLLTGCGFTTRESESLLAAKPRRRLTQVTMLFGYVFNVTIVTAFVNVFLSMKSSQFDNYLYGLMIPISIAVFIILITKVGPIRVRIDRVFEKIAGKIASKAPFAVQVCKKIINNTAELDYTSASAFEIQGFTSVFATEDRIEGTTAFVEKRKPEWKGR